MPTQPIQYAGYAPSQQPYEVGGQPWGMPAVMPPGQIGPYQGLGDWGTDPFGYSGGSMLKPWTQPLPDLAQFRGGNAAPDLKAWQYGDFGYNYTAPGGYNAKEIATPDKFTYMNMDPRGEFRAPTEAEMQADPAYQAAMQSGTAAIDRSAAKAGTLRGGGTLKGLMDFGNRLGTQTYADIYGRRRSEYDLAGANAKDLYATNRANTAENYDRNQRNAFEVAQANEGNRLNAYQASSDVSLRGGELGYNIATGTYDRNQANAKAMLDSQNEIARAQASAANAGAAQDYQRTMAHYGLAYDIYNQNQDTQFGRLAQMANMGMGAAGQQAAYAGNYGQGMADLYTGGANARAAGTIGAANSINQGIGGVLNTGMDLYGMYQMGRRPPSPFQPYYGPMPGR
jgi:hypothetical protein